MSAVFAAALIAVIILSVPYAIRMVIGPTVFDRLVGLNGLGTSAAVLIILDGLVYERLDMLVDLALALFLLNLITTLLLARFLAERPERSTGGRA
jgi:multicomponent Na+:H+ antiporter subunit F